MKKTYLSLILLFSVVGFAQINNNAPWKKENQNSRVNNFQNDVISFNEYWKTHDKNKKGSGYKPFKRWESFYENQLNPDGTIITPQQLWEAWKQKNSAKLAKNNSVMALPPSNWQAVGPFTHTNTGSWSSGQGRVNVVAVDPNNTNTIYIGAPAGGIWKSTNSGTTWTPLSDELPQIGVSGIAIDHTDSNTIFIATGDRDASDTYSIGVLKSTDGGLNWVTTGLTFTGTGNQTGDLIMHPTNNQIMLCATSAGLYRTTNGGTTWTIEQNGDFSQGSIRFKPNNPTIVYATTNNGFYKSTNTGDTFTNITSGLSAAASTTRMILDVTPANPEYIYVLSISNAAALNGLNGIYRSTNGGTSFTATQTTTDILESGQGWYDLALAVSNTDANTVFTGCLNVWKSTNGGANATKINNWSSPTSASYTHADIHFLKFLNGKLYCGSDGGVYVSANNGTNFTDLTAGLQISQFYRVSVSKTSAGKMVGGLQDNGGYAYSNSSWKNYYGADGMDAAVSQTNSNLYYGFIQNGSSMYISNNAGNSISSNVGSPGGIEGEWITPLRGDSQGNMYSGFDGLYKLVNGAWVLQNTNSVGSENLEHIAIDPSNDNIIYVANGNSLYKSIDAGITFSLASTLTSAITSICVHFSNSNIVYITRSGTNGQAMMSTNGGTSFTNIASGLPAIAKNCIVHQGRNTDNPLYVGTSLGVYYKDDTMTTWQPFDTNLPNVSVRDLEINLEDNKIIAATYGRGIWQSDIPVQIPTSDVKFISVNNPNVNINCGTSVTPQITVKNGGSSVISSVTVNYTIDSTPYNYNWTGSIAAGTNQNIDLPAIVTTRGAHNLSFAITTAGDAFSDNNNGATPFYVNDLGTVGVNNPFTNTTDELIVMTDTGANWTRGNRTSGALNTSGNTAYVTNTSGNYADNTKTHLVSQCYNLSNVINPTISFKLAYDLELNWDIVYVEYSTNFGASWSLLGTMGSGWYNSDRTPATTGSDCSNCPGGQWTGTNTTNTTYTYPLTSLNSQTNVIFRIVFHSDGGVVQLGANVDDFIITGTLSNDSFEMNSISIYPNPSKGLFTISLGNSISNKIEVFDLTGKTIVTKFETLQNQTTIDLSNASDGVYFVKIITENGEIVKRIIKN